MKHSQSVTPRELTLPDGVTLMSISDLQGRISYVKSKSEFGR